MAKRKNDFDKFMKSLVRESDDTGEDEALATYGEHFRLALEVIRLRKMNKWTQQQFAKKSGVPQSEISRIESGQANPTYRTLQMLAKATRMTVSFVAQAPQRRRATS